MSDEKLTDYKATVIALAELFAELDWDENTERLYKRMILRAQVNSAEGEERAIALEKFRRIR